mmetsp:Transcript_4405/g.10772  ORF Transcript_4405/g.10772 Transcript_4405/m.10772 type:complete len:250 (+) Transcript_4405:897-1646(+)
MVGDLEHDRRAGINKLLFAHEHLVVGVVGGDHVLLGGLWGGLRLFFSWHPCGSSSAPAPLAFAFVRAAKYLGPEFVVQPLQSIVVDIHVVLALCIAAAAATASAAPHVRDGKCAFHAKLRRLFEHFNEHLFVEVVVVRVGVCLALRSPAPLVIPIPTAAVDTAAPLSSCGLPFCGSLPLGSLCLLLDPLELLELGHNHLGGFILLDVPDVVHRARGSDAAWGRRAVVEVDVLGRRPPGPPGGPIIRHVR